MIGTTNMAKHVYVSLSAEESQECVISSSHKSERDYEKGISTNFWRNILPWLIHALLILTYATVWIAWPVWRKIPEFDVPASRVPIEHQTIQFFDGMQNISEYQGPSNPKTDRVWGNLIDVGGGILLVDEETAKNLPTQTSKVPGTDSYAVALEVFHQLHCLNRIRKLFYNHTRNDHNESALLFTYHTEHCFDYLRQSLMCHGDVGFMSMDYDEEHNYYYAKFGVVKQCRNFDKMRDWAMAHQFRQ